MTSDAADSRPSFSDYLKKRKEDTGRKDIEFVDGFQPKHPQSVDTGTQLPDEQQKQQQQQTSKDKAKARRAQVRKAQIQHRQRKADYVKQLELDVTHFRELIEQAERDVAVLRRENEAIRVTLGRHDASASDARSVATGQGSDVLVGTDAMQSQPMELDVNITEEDTSNAPLATEMFGDINVSDLTVTLSQDDELGTPCFNISSSSGSDTTNTSSPPRSEDSGRLSTAQELMAINFILSLEHICWDHFFLGDFPSHSEESEAAMGHTLMASTMCMATAPESVFMGRRVVGPVSSTCTRGRKPPRPDPSAPRIDLSWSGSPDISLESLHGLAVSLNPGDVELTPVQAWFELMDRYPVERLLDEALLDELRMQLNGVVKCLSFGAVIERGAFESVVSRVLDGEQPGVEDVEDVTDRQ